MRTKIVYVVVSDESDYFMEQTCLSIRSLHLHSPGLEILLVTDKKTEATLGYKLRNQIFGEVSKVLSFETPDGFDKIRRSRYLKTNLRNLIDGDFLFIDSDTIICDSLEEIDSLPVDLGLVADQNDSLPLKNSFVLDKCETAGFKGMEGCPYYNSGVMLVRDNIDNRAFYNLWYQNWFCSQNNGLVYDQPALCRTNQLKGFPIQEMDGIWNCQFKMKGYPFLKNAKIMHYYGNNGSNSLTWAQERLFYDIREKGINNTEVYDFLNNTRTVLYTLFSMKDEQLMSFLNTPLIYAKFTSSRIFKWSENLAEYLLKIKSAIW